MLYIVATPIGNLKDLTYRAVEILSTVDLILAEDTRVSRNLLMHYGITTQSVAYHEFNKEKATPRLIESLKQGQNMALITDAGTPGIADPAFYMVRACLQNDIAVSPIPGPSAFIAALVCSGLPTEKFIFENFLPHKSAQRIRLFDSLKDETRTVIFHETPHRILKVLEEMQSVLGDISVVIAREITKVHEEFLRGTPQQLTMHFQKKPPRGEMVVMFNLRYQLTNSETKLEENT